MANIEVNIGGKRYTNPGDAIRSVSLAFMTAPDRAGPQLAKDMRDFLTRVGTTLARRHGNPYPARGENYLSRRSGDLVLGLQYGVKVTGERISDLEGGFDLPDYAQIQEDGGTVTVKRARYLAIPLPDALYGDGTPIRQSPRDWDKTFVATSRQGNLIIFRRDRNRVVPLYLLKRSVTIPPRLGLADEVYSELGYFADKALTTVLNKVLNEE